MPLLPGVGPIQVATPRVLGGSTGHWSNTHWTCKKTSQTSQQGITQNVTSQSITGHRPSSHWSLDLENIHPGERQYSPVNQPPVTGHQTLYQSVFSDTHAMGLEFTTNRANLGSEHSFRHEVQNPNNNSKRVFITPGTGF